MIDLKILVTGGAGFIGSNIANTLKKEGNDVVVLDDLSLGTTSNLAEGVEFLWGSVMDRDVVNRVASDCDYIFHDAAMSSSQMFADDPRAGVDVNMMGFMNIMESARKSGKVSKVIYASSSSIYNGLAMPFNEGQVISPKTFYEVSFYCREVAARSYFLEYGVPSIGLRYFSVYGRNERHKGKYANNISQFLWDMAEGSAPVIYGDGSQSRDFTQVDDVVQANLLAMRSEKEFGIYNVGTGVETTFNQVIDIINRELGTEIRPKYVNNPIKNYVQDTLADILLIKTELKYSPVSSIEQGIKSLVADLQSAATKKMSQATTSA